jgi:hypothetical protein
VRYVRERPGELVHIDVKKLGRIPPGGGHRLLGRNPETARRNKLGMGYDYLHVAVDDHSRVAFVRVFPDEQGQTTARFLNRPGSCRGFRPWKGWSHARQASLIQAIPA